MQLAIPKRRYLHSAIGLLALWIIATAAPAAAVSISGILVYSTDDFGNPNGYETWQGNFQAQAWRTLVRGGQVWYGLGITSGLPPKSIDGRFLNFPDFTVELPLDEGENYFTLFAEPGPLTATDDFQRFLINLYFDGDLEKPGITVLFPRYADPDGSAVAPARPNDDQMYSLALNQVPATPQSFYDDGAFRVSVLRVSLLSPERANLSVDRLTPYTLAPGGVDGDWVGALTISVEPSEAFGAGGGAPPVASTGSSGGARSSGGGGNVQPRAGSAGVLPPPIAVQQAPVQGDVADSSARSGGGKATPGEFWHKGGDHKDDKEGDADLTPTPADVAAALRDWLAEEAALTQTPALTGTPVPTLTPGSKTPAPSTPTKSPTPAGTPTPALTPSQSPVSTVAHGAGTKD